MYSIQIMRWALFYPMCRNEEVNWRLGKRISQEPALYYKTVDSIKAQTRKEQDVWVVLVTASFKSVSKIHTLCVHVCVFSYTNRFDMQEQQKQRGELGFHRRRHQSRGYYTILSTWHYQRSEGVRNETSSFTKTCFFFPLTFYKLFSNILTC